MGLNSFLSSFQKNLNLYYTCRMTPKRVTSGGAHLRGLAPGQHSSEETSRRWWAIDDTVSDLTSLGIEPQTSRSDSNILPSELTRRLLLKQFVSIIFESFFYEVVNFDFLAGTLRRWSLMLHGTQTAPYINETVQNENSKLDVSKKFEYVEGMLHDLEDEK